MQEFIRAGGVLRSDRRSFRHPAKGLVSMSESKRILIISSNFPPTSGSGVQRVVGFVKYLPEFGWDPYVLTIVPGPYHATGSPSEVPDNLPSDRIVRTPFFDIRLAGKRLLLRLAGKGAPFTPAETARAQATDERTGSLLWSLANTFVFVPDPEVGWLPFGVRGGLSTIRRAGISAIVSSAPAFTAHLIALRLKRKTGVRWVADFRDPWSQNPYVTVRRFQKIRGPSDRVLEHKVVKFADAITTVSEPIADGFGHLGVRGIRRKLQVITNGYDPEEFAGMIHHPPPAFTIAYTGTFYGETRSPVPFLRALAEVIESGLIERHRIRVNIIERFSQRTARLAARYKLSDVVTVRTDLSHAETIREQVNASVLLLIVRDDAYGMGIYTGKIFEYLGARRPILALAPKGGVASELIREANAGTVVNASNRQAMKEAIVKYYSEHERTGDVAYHGRGEVIRRYERPVLAGQLARLLDSLTSQ